MDPRRPQGSALVIEQDEMSEQVTILYIGGSGRSGSTILAQVTGQVPGFVNVGELWHVWDRGLQYNELCGCGQPFHSCEFWSAVGAAAFGGWENVDVDRMVALRPLLRRLRYIPHYALFSETGICTPRMYELLRESEDVHERLYRAIRDVSGARVIVDSSKYLPYAFLLSVLPFADLRVVHLIRDSRAVAYSWSRSKVRPEVVGRRDELFRLSPVSVCRSWNSQNGLYGLLSRSVSFSTLRYEDFVRAPDFYINKVFSRLAFEEAGNLHLVDGGKVSLAVEHSVSGNPRRFETGMVQLRPDEEWKVNMKGVDKSIVTALTAGLLLKYGYLGGRKKVE